ncbi:hypothetical protein EJF36_12510 [Bacillus sp. HMF5848]|uniref:hypothetical protein n=1 Tax=Bacillus sp. HMF5848 TaxID=2495421 RepID=UPI000F7BA22B|nr:hypothetical protein [Bacillus sp. HMF5848]RSK27632.1 hypothetical protein EJF36_12510 [Bacillus sp. HMF5848]
MTNSIEVKLQELFNSIQIQPEYSRSPLEISQFHWNQKLDDFVVEYVIGNKKYIFHFDVERAANLNSEQVFQDPLEQLEFEVNYIKRMHERGIGAKEYYPFTDITTYVG